MTGPQLTGELRSVAARVASGSRVGIGGLLSERRPIAALVALANAGVRELELVCLTGSIDIDLAVALGLASRVRSSFVSLGLHGLAPALAAARASGAVDVPVETEMSIVAGLRAAIAGVGFLPMRAWDGTDISSSRPDVATIRCPYTDQSLVAFPALPLDVAIIHVPLADHTGTCVIASDVAIDSELLRAARTRIVTAERVVDDVDDVDLEGMVVPGFDVDVVVEAPGGAWPTGCMPLYGPDLEAFDRYANGPSDRAELLFSMIASKT